ncbi:hypothetical protein THASP1DRAFT_28439, partial [Thamnocephalis sphaerospora]
MAHRPDGPRPRHKRRRRRESTPPAERPAWAALSVLGYEAKLFDDPMLATRAAAGEFLLPWRDETVDPVLVDRFDVRNLLDNEQLRRATAESRQPLALGSSRVDDALEQMLDALRYADLNAEEAPDESDHEYDAYGEEEEERKRKQLVDEGRAFHYDYGAARAKDQAAKVQPGREGPREARGIVQDSMAADYRPPHARDGPAEEPFVPTFSIPDGMITPDTKRHAEIIE